MTYKNAIPVVELEPGLWLIAAQGTDKPKLAWTNGEEYMKAGKGSLWREIAFTTKKMLQTWWVRLDNWLRDSNNDCLRARGDIRWRTACRAEMLLRDAK